MRLVSSLSNPGICKKCVFYSTIPRAEKSIVSLLLSTDRETHKSQSHFPVFNFPATAFCTCRVFNPPIPADVNAQSQSARSHFLCHDDANTIDLHAALMFHFGGMQITRQRATKAIITQETLSANRKWRAKSHHAMRYV